MENTAKALLIAAGFLIAILLLTLFSYLFTKMGESTSRIYEIMQKKEVAEFNQPFLNYNDRNDLTIHDVATIVNLAIDNNKAKKYPITIEVFVDGNNKANDWADKYKDNSNKILEDNIVSIQNKYTYTCKVDVDKTALLVNKVTITKN